MSLGRLNDLHDMPPKKYTSDCRQKSGMKGEKKCCFWELLTGSGVVCRFSTLGGTKIFLGGGICRKIRIQPRTHCVGIKTVVGLNFAVLCL